MGDKVEKNSKNNAVAGSPERVRFLSIRNHQTPLCIAVATLIVVLLCLGGYYVYDHFWGVDVEVELAGQEEMLVKLREVEVEWDADMVADWEEKKSYPLDYTVPYALYEVPRFEKETAVLKVGEETLYTDDFNYYLYIHHFSDFSSGEELSDELLVEVAEALIEESVALQEGAYLEVVRLEEDIYNATGKDYGKRGAAVISIEEFVINSELAEVSGEMIQIWFNNVNPLDPPEIEIDVAQEYALEKITDLHGRIVSGELTFEEAGEEIMADSTIQEMDPGVLTNAYDQFELIGGVEEFIDPKLYESIVVLEASEVSEVLLRGIVGEEGYYDAYYVVAVVDTNETGVHSFEEWIDEMMGEYTVLVINGT